MFFFFFKSSGDIGLSVFFWRGGQNLLNLRLAVQLVTKQKYAALAGISEIVSVTSMLPVFAPSIKNRKASNLSIDGSLMSDFGLYRSLVEGGLRGKVTSVGGGQFNDGVKDVQLRPTHLEQGTLCPFCKK